MSRECDLRYGTLTSLDLLRPAQSLAFLGASLVDLQCAYLRQRLLQRIRVVNSPLGGAVVQMQHGRTAFAQSREAGMVGTNPTSRFKHLFVGHPSVCPRVVGYGAFGSILWHMLADHTGISVRRGHISCLRFPS